MGKIDKFDIEISLKEIEKNIEDEETKFKDKISKLLRRDKKEYFKYLNEEVLKLIDNVDRRIHYWENRRTQFLQIALGLLAASIAGILTVLPEIEKNRENYFGFNSTLFYYPLLITLIVLVIGCIRIIWYWNLQNNPSYPFTKSFSVWRWQYRYAEQEGSKIDTEIQNQDKDKFINEAKKFQSNLMNYKEKTLNSDVGELLNQNMSQLFLLITNEKYKIKFVSKLRDILVDFLKFSLYSFLGTLILILISFSCRFCS